MEVQKQVYSIINLGYYNNLETAADLLVILNTSRRAIWADAPKHKAELWRVVTAMTQFEEKNNQW